MLKSFRRHCTFHFQLVAILASILIQTIYRGYLERPLCLNAAQDGDYNELVDPRLEDQYEPHEMARMVACAAAAIRHSTRRRPKMSQIQNKSQQKNGHALDQILKVLDYSRFSRHLLLTAGDDGTVHLWDDWS